MHKSDNKDAIDIDGVKRSRFNSDGQSIHSTEDGIRNFWRWFGDSRAVDSEGRPLIVYHGSPTGGFTEFDKAKAKKTAKEKSRQAADDGLGFWFSLDKSIAELHRDKDKGWGPSWMIQDGELYAVYLKLENPLYSSVAEGRFEEDDSRLEGHESIIYEMPGSDEYIALCSKQIKSASGNSGAFDLDNKDIYDVRGLIPNNDDLSDSVESETSLGMS